MRSSFYMPTGFNLRIGYDMAEGVSPEFSASIEKSCTIYIDTELGIASVDYAHTPPREWKEEI